jgi:hypothetical protein
MAEHTKVESPFWEMIRNTPVVYPKLLERRSQLDGSISFFNDDGKLKGINNDGKLKGINDDGKLR